MSSLSRYFNLLCIAFLLISIISCKKSKISNQTTTDDLIQMLTGTWEMKTYKLQEEIKYIEKWTKVDDLQFNGKSILSNKDKNNIFHQSDFQLIKKQNSWNYILYPKSDEQIFNVQQLSNNKIRFNQMNDESANYIQYSFITEQKIEVERGSNHQEIVQSIILLKQ